jgi:hypothetical protein
MGDERLDFAFACDVMMDLGGFNSAGYVFSQRIDFEGA